MRCSQERVVWDDTAMCARCVHFTRRLANAKPLRACHRCGKVATIAADDICDRCYNHDPGRIDTFRAGIESRLQIVPGWFDPLVSWARERLSVIGAVSLLRDTARVIDTAANTNPSAVLAAAGDTTIGATLRCFFVENGDAFRVDPGPRRHHAACQRRLDATPMPWRETARLFAAAESERRARAERRGLRVDAFRTIETRLTVIRDLAVRLDALGRDGWTSVSRSDIESFVSSVAGTRRTQLLSLDRFFQWARRRRLILTNPVSGMKITQPIFRGSDLTLDDQRRAFRRWTTGDASPSESFIGLAALLHGASRAELRVLRVEDIDVRAQTIRFGRRAAMVMDPYTWHATLRCLEHHATSFSHNPFLLAAGRQRGRTEPSSLTALDDALRPARPASFRSLRAARLARMVAQHDPIIVAGSHAISHKAALYYLTEGLTEPPAGV